MDPLLITPDRQVSAAMTAEMDRLLREHLDKGPDQEDMTFAYWRPSIGATRVTAILTEAVLPDDGERILQGNVAFTPEYLDRVLQGRPDGSGVALLHSHLGPGWQGMSDDDIVAEQDRLGGACFGQSGLPVLGLTLGTDGAWSARLWQREAPRTYVRHWAQTVRVIGKPMRTTYHPDAAAAEPTDAQVATVSVWGQAAQAELARARVGIVGLGSVGSIVAEALGRVGFSNITLIDFDLLEQRNLDRTLGAIEADVTAGLSKVQVATRNVAKTATSPRLNLLPVDHNLLDEPGFLAALDCDVLICCVDRPWPRFLLNSLAYAHLIPVIDGGIAAHVKPDGTPLHVAWRIHTVGPEHACMVCQDAIRLSDVALDREGKLDDPDYIQGLSPEDRARFSRRNVFPFSLSVASHEVLQLIGLLTGTPRIGGTGAQTYQAYPGEMSVTHHVCRRDCEFEALTATAADLSPNLRPGDREGPPEQRP